MALSQCHNTKALSLNATVPRHSVSTPQYHGTVSLPQYHSTQPHCNCTKTSRLNAMVPTHSMLMPQHHTPSLTANIILPYVTHFLSLVTPFYSKLKNSSVFVNWPNSLVPCSVSPLGFNVLIAYFLKCILHHLQLMCGKGNRKQGNNSFLSHELHYTSINNWQKLSSQLCSETHLKALWNLKEVSKGYSSLKLLGLSLSHYNFETGLPNHAVCHTAHNKE
jgi:hypothetical protein